EQVAARERLKAALAKLPAGNRWIDFWRERLDQVRRAPASPVRGGGPLRLVEVKRNDETVTYGYATGLAFRPEPRTKAGVQLRDPGGKTLAIVTPRGGRVLGDLGDVVRGDLVLNVAGREFRADEKGTIR